MPVAGVPEREEDAGLRLVEEGADLEEGAELGEGEGRGGDGLPEGGLQGGVGGEVGTEGGERAGDGFPPGEVVLARLGGGFLLDDQGGGLGGGGRGCGVGGFADGGEAEALAEEVQHALADVRRGVGAEDEEEPAEHVVVAGEAELDEAAEGREPQVGVAAVLGVLKEICGAGGDATRGHEASFTIEGGCGEDIVIGGNPFVDTAVAVDLF